VKGLNFRYFFISSFLAIGIANADEYWGLEAWIGNLFTPNFEEYKDITERKKAFFMYLLPTINEHNTEITKLRKRIINNSISEEEIYNLKKLYKIDKDSDTSRLLNSVDIVPASLVLAQAAMESDWGRSRFAKYYHNFFGLWCFREGCGVIPMDRDNYASHEVAKFSSLDKAVKYYMLSINRNPAYEVFRQIRKSKRDNNIPLRGISLSEGLDNYAEIGYEYVEIIKKIIIFNKLERFDNIMLPLPVLQYPAYLSKENTEQ